MLQSILILSLYIIGALAAPNSRPRRVCGNHYTNQPASTRLENRPSRLPTDLTGAQIAQNVTIPVHWHVLMSGSSRSQGNVPAKQITDSIDVMNKRYRKTGFSFQLVNTTRTRNPTWFNNIFKDTPLERVIKGALHQGGAETLNVYTASFKNVPLEVQGLLGYATFPSMYADDPELDGVVINYRTLPGGDLEPYDLGITLVHETGHWFELFHTFNEEEFEGTCEGLGDQVDDTPTQRFASEGCPVNQDSCPGGGKDAVHNYMDYSDDACMTEFTPGQVTRMQSFYSTYRAQNII